MALWEETKTIFGRSSMDALSPDWNIDTLGMIVYSLNLPSF